VSGADQLGVRVRQYLESLPGKRGRDIPEDVYDAIHHVASGITMPLWGRPPTPQQMQHLYDTGTHDPQGIHDAFGGLPHPHAPNLKVGEYQSYQRAHEEYRKHR
jgi:hypothetical protein